MKTLIKIIIASIITVGTFFTSTAQSQEAYMKAMVSGFQTMSSESPEQLLMAASQFERIAANVEDQWHPQYYAALCNIRYAFTQKDITVKDQYTAKALTQIKVAKELAPNNSEIVALEGFYYMAYLSADAGTRGQLYSGRAMQTFGAAIQLNPSNPRALMLMAQMQYGTAQFFNSSTAEACGMNSKSIALFEAEEKGKSFEPTWGVEMAQSMIAKCAN
jgi:hypothetical protein